MRASGLGLVGLGFRAQGLGFWAWGSGLWGRQQQEVGVGGYIGDI